MISVKWREKGEKGLKVFIAKQFTYSGREGEFALYDNDDLVQLFITPVYLEATATVNAPRKGKEE